MPEQPSAGPSRPPQVQPIRSPTRSRSLASLLKGKEASSNDSSLLSPVSPASSASMRRAASHEDAPGLSAEVPPLPPPKTATGKPLTDPLLHAARAKMSSQDQEAMRKLRSTMVELSEEGSTKSPTASTSASTSNSPNSAMFPSIATSASSHHLRSRRSTLSRLVVPEEETPTANPLLAPAQYHIAILGHSGVGKTTLLNRALKTWGVTPPNNVPYAIQKVTTYRSDVKPGGRLKLSSNCELLELALNSLNLEDEGSGLFPDGLPRVSGAVLCYDARAGESLHLIPEAIHRLVDAGIPTIMYACKSDPDATLQIDAAHANSIGEAYNVGLIEVTDTTSEGRSKMRNGMRWLLYKMEQRLIRRRRKAMGSPTSAPTVLSADSDGGSSADRIMWPAKLGMTPGSASASKRGSMTSEARSSSSDLQWIVQGSGHTTSQAESLPASDDAVVDGAVVDSDLKPKSDADNTMWVGLQDLFNQLFSKIVSSSDDLFVDSFFMTYRRFCQPREVMAHFLDRYKRIEGYPVAQASKNWTLQRLTSALIDWTADYPGDLADIVTQSLFRQILQLLLKYTFMAHLTVSLAEVEATISDFRDIDSSWAIKLSESTISLKSTQSELAINEGILYDLESPLDKSEEVLTPLTREHSASVRTTSTTSLNLDNMRNGSGSLGTGSLQDERMVKSIDEAGSKWSGALGFVLNTDPKVFAAELTKRQWQLFAAIRPRDVFRHDFGKEKDDPIGDAITFFNHLSRWVSTVILADPKAKYRARAFERFMMIAHELRRLNNYDSLYALMSGMQETSIHRLSHTHALVQPPLDVSKNFQSHSKLMDARGNYTHYQRALRADIDAGRPAIPLITILISLVAKMQSVRREDIRPDGMVQWDKFMRFGEILAIIPKCQARGAIVPGKSSKTFMTILHNVPVIHDEDGLFDRSRMLEPPGAAYQQPNVLKRFGKLAMA